MVRGFLEADRSAILPEYQVSQHRSRHCLADVLRVSRPVRETACQLCSDRRICPDFL